MLQITKTETALLGQPFANDSDRDLFAERILDYAL